MAPNEQSKKRLALAVIDFLNSSIKDGSIPPDQAESIEIATSCVAEAFNVDPADESAVQDALGGKSLLDVFGVYEKMRTAGGSKSSTSSSSSSKPAATSNEEEPAGPDPKDKEEGEKLKNQGNAAMKEKNYAMAIDLYTQALDKVPLNPIFLSNRAAAYSGDGQHRSAASDAEMAVAADPKFAKAWSRLGYARFALGDNKGSMEAYKKGISAEGSGGSAAMRNGYETAKRKAEAMGEDVDAIERDTSDQPSPMGGPGGMPNLGALGSMFGGGGGPGGAGGMPDFSNMMNNPMMQQMAQSIMSDPDKLNSILNNPALESMFGDGPGGSGGSGGGMPDMASMMQDPAIRDLAQNLMGNGGGAGRGDKKGPGDSS